MLRAIFTSTFVALGFLLPCSGQSLQPIDHPVLFGQAGSELPQVAPNNNLMPEGEVVDGVLKIALNVTYADWRIETDEWPGLKVAAVAGADGIPQIPAPLIRVVTGTRVDATITNSLPDSSITVFGFQQRPATKPDSLLINPGETGRVVFDVGEAGTYFYSIQLGKGIDPLEGERDQLAGAFIIDSEGELPDDRIFVMNIYSAVVDSSVHRHGYVDALAINGKSWPYTERLHPEVGDSLRWRIINASGRNHPMHLHGFFYDVVSSGSMLTDETYPDGEERTVVTESMLSGTTMTMEWVPTRPGKWLFHCHLSFHVSPEIRLQKKESDHHHGGEFHMAGLVLGIEIPDGPTDLVDEGEPRHVDLFVNEVMTDTSTGYTFALAADEVPDLARPGMHGPLLLLKKHQPTFVNVINQTSMPTGVHWHGLELDSWADGVPGWSSSDGKVSPVIEPGRSFTYKLSLMRSGTFIYHSHLDDVHQLTAGLYGALLVVDNFDDYDPATDHVYMVGWKSPEPQSPADLVINGGSSLEPMRAKVGERHRLRVINIAPAGRIRIMMTRDEFPVPIVAVAKDGAALPMHQQREINESSDLGVGETADFVFVADKPGEYKLDVGYERFKWSQVWTVD